MTRPGAVIVRLDFNELQKNPEYVFHLNLLLAELNPDAWVVSWLDLKKWLHDPNFTLFGAIADGFLVGMASLYIVDTLAKRIGLVQDVVVSAFARRLGIAENLMKTIKNFAGKNRVDCLDLTSSRAAAQKLYEKLGYEKRDTKIYRLKLTTRAK
jgi:ribosomal protein S18 acetylase RimI-like enzyme